MKYPILVSKAGVFRQVKLYRRGREIYAGFGTGFLRLFANGGTSTPHVRQAGIDMAGLLVDEDQLGRVVVGNANG